MKQLCVWRRLIGVLVGVTAITAGPLLAQQLNVGPVYISEQPGVINATVYGAQANGVIAIGGAITMADTSFSSTSTEFLPVDVGKLIVVEGAGPSGNALVTSIAAYVDSHTVKLAATASTTVRAANFEYATNDVAAINAAIAAAAARPHGAKVMLPPGRMIVVPGAGQIILASGVTLEGNGAHIRCASVADSSPAQLNACIYGTNLARVKIKDITVKGIADLTPTASPDLTALGGLIHIQSSTDVVFDSIDVGYSRGYAVSAFSSTRVTMVNSHIHHTMWAGFGAGNSSDIVVAGNQFNQCADAWFAASTSDHSPGPVNARAITVTGNVAVECVGINISGPHALSIVGNTMVRSIQTAIYVAPFYNWNVGNSPHVGVTITGNTILDVIQNVSFAVSDEYLGYIIVDGGPRRAGKGESVPGYPVSRTGAMTNLFGENSPGRFWDPALDPNTPSPGGAFWTISNNTLARTLPPVSSYSEWGYGGGMWQGMKVLPSDGITNRGSPYTGAISDAHFRVSGIVILRGLRFADIRANVVATTGNHGLFVRATDLNTGDLDGLRIMSNTFYDYKLNGILIRPASLMNSQIVISDNDFNADPRIQNSNRGPGGTWLANSTPLGINAAKVSGMFIDRNRFRNLSNPMNLVGGKNYIGSNNVLYGIPAAEGFSTGNVGVGTVSGIGGVEAPFQYVHEDGNPTSPTFGQILTASTYSRNSVPIGGAWLRGAFVQNKAPTVSGGKILLGWSRLTTGTDNVVGTDWSPVYATVAP